MVRRLRDHREITGSRVRAEVGQTPGGLGSRGQHSVARDERVARGRTAAGVRYLIRIAGDHLDGRQGQLQLAGSQLSHGRGGTLAHFDGADFDNRPLGIGFNDCGRMIVPAQVVAHILAPQRQSHPEPPVSLGSGEPGREPRSPARVSATSRHCSRPTPCSRTCPVGMTLPLRSRLRRRNSAGSRPSSAASLPICISMAKFGWLEPKPRMAAAGGALVKTAWASTATCGTA